MWVWVYAFFDSFVESTTLFISLSFLCAKTHISCLCRITRKLDSSHCSEKICMTKKCIKRIDCKNNAFSEPAEVSRLKKSQLFLAGSESAWNATNFQHKRVINNNFSPKSSTVVFFLRLLYNNCSW